MDLSVSVLTGDEPSAFAYVWTTLLIFVINCIKPVAPILFLIYGFQVPALSWFIRLATHSNGIPYFLVILNNFERSACDTSYTGVPRYL
jgi:hypothetical protein